MSAKDLFLERSLPSSVDAERSVLGSILLDNRLCNQAMEVLRPDDFYLDAHRKVYEKMISLSEQGRPIDPITLGEELRRVGEFEQVGGGSYVAGLIDTIPRLENIEQYTKIVKDKATLRRLIATSNQIIASCFEQEQDTAQIIDHAEKSIFAIAEDRMREGFTDVGTIAHKRLEEIEAMAGRAEMITGVPTGFTDLDKMTAGLQRSDLVVVAARPSMGKCLAYDSEIVLADGSVATIEEVYRAGRARLLTLTNDWKLAWAEPSAFVDDGRKPVFRVTTRLGRSVETTITHPFLTVDGWRRLAQLKPGEKIAVPRKVDVFGDQEIRECEVKLLAYFLGDGCLTGACPTFTNGNIRIMRDFVSAVDAFGGVVTRDRRSAGRTPSVAVVSDPEFIERERKAFGRRLAARLAATGRTQRSLAHDLGVTPSLVCQWLKGACAPGPHLFAGLCQALSVDLEALAPYGVEAIGKNQKNPVAFWLDSLGLLGKDAHRKLIPAALYRLPKDQVALLLNRLFSTDGWASVLESGQPQLGYATVSERLGRQIQHLLLRFGIIASLRQRTVRYNGTQRYAWQLDITDGRSIEAFCEQIGIFGKEDAVAAVVHALGKRAFRTNRDLVPVSIWSQIGAAKGAESWASLARRAGISGATNIHVGTRALSRPRLGALASAVKDARLSALAVSDVYWDEIVSIEPCGLKQVYDLTIPETHNFVANDVCVHNTSLALNVAQYAARSGYTVGVFSLEMSAQQLVSRLLCSEAHIDAHRFRTGYLNREEWARLADGLHRLSESRIFIDDSPGITVLEMRAKARRLKQEHGLDMLLVDYLQLIQGRGRVDSRTNEVSQISRDLKMLAKELNVPLIALSQLSRAPETRTDHRPQLSDLRESGCLAGDTLVTLADTGARVPIRDLVGRSGFRVWALDEATMRTVPAVVSRAFATGTKPVFRLETKLGRVIRATGNHKFRTLDGWRRLDELEVGERLAVPRRVPCGDAGTISFAEAALLGHLIGDGCTLPRHVIQYTTREPELAEVVVELATNVFGKLIEPRVKRERTWYQVYLPAAFHLTHGKRTPVAAWLDGLGVFGLRSYEKRVPERMFEQSEEVIGRFLRHLWATDGCIRPPYETDKPYPTIYFTSSSERLSRDVQTLLLRLGINAVVRPISQGGKGRTQFTVRVMGRDDILTFAEKVGAAGSRRQEALAECVAWLEHRVAKTNRDVVPNRVWEHFVLPASKRRGQRLGSLTTALGYSAGPLVLEQNVSRNRLMWIASALGNDRCLSALATSDVYWDKIVSIEPDGVEEVFDLTVEDHHNFEANVYYVHNSIEQDADVVAFIYREEMYGATDENQGVAELIIGKQRNGPTGSVRLAFLKEFTRFENLWNEGY
jgi:replicative DNA helicase